LKKSVSRSKTRQEKTLVLGIGNLLLGDEGIGVIAVQHLASSGLADRAVFIDGGTGSFELLSLLQDYPHIIMIDAAADERPPGTVSHLAPRFARDFPRSLTAHDIGLRDLIEAASLLSELPKIDLITISIEKMQLMTLDISESVRNALPEIEKKVRELLRP
jgi:hydrogenase maturation protease